MSFKTPEALNFVAQFQWQRDDSFVRQILLKHYKKIVRNICGGFNKYAVFNSFYWSTFALQGLLPMYNAS